MEWAEVRLTLVSRFESWLDIAGQSEEGRAAIERLQQSWFAEPNSFGLPLSANRNAAHLNAEVGREVKDSEVISFSDPLAEASHWLLELVGELTALRHELKLQTKGSRSMIESFAENLRLMESTSIAMLKRIEAPIVSNPDAAAKAHCESLVELDEGARRLVQATQSLTQELSDTASGEQSQWLSSAPWYARSAVKKVAASMIESVHKQQSRLKSVAEGVALYASRVESHLSKMKIERFGEVGETVNPHLMEVIEVVPSESGAPGTVARLVRPGYRIGELVIKTAQVVAVARAR